MESFFYSIKKYSTLGFIICLTYIIGGIAYGYAFANFTPSHDGMMVITRDQDWMTSIGRFMVRYYIAIRGKMDAPWFIGVLGLLFISLASFLMVKILQVESKAIPVIVISSLLLLNISIVSTAAVFIYIFDVLALAMLLATLSVYISIKYDGIANIFVASFILAVAMGFYQSFLSFAVGVYMLLLIKLLIQKTDRRTWIKKCTSYLASVGLGGALYALLMKCALFITGVQAYEGAYNSVTNVFDLSFSKVVNLIPACYKFFLKFFYLQKIYNSRVIIVINYMLLAIGIVLYISTAKILEKWQKAALGVLAILFPLGLNNVYVLSNGVTHQLMTHSFVLYYIVLLLPMFYADFGKVRYYKVVAVLYGIMFFCVIRFANDLFYYQHLVGIGTETAMTNIVYDIECTEDFEIEESRIVILGNITEALSAKYWLNDNFNYAAGMTNSGTTITYNDIFIKYMQFLLGKRYLYEFDEDIVNTLESDEEVVKMPCYPRTGYCRMVDGYLVMKFTE